MPAHQLSLRFQRVFEIAHPPRRNLTAIRGYVRLGGPPDNPHTDPQDRSWFGPHDRLFDARESEDIDFIPGPSHGKSLYSIVSSLITFFPHLLL